MPEDREYPRWVHCPGTIPGKKSALVQNAQEEAAQLAKWDAESAPPANGLIGAPPAGRAAPETPASPPRLPQLDHDGDGKPGGSKKGGWPKGRPRAPKASN